MDWIEPLSTIFQCGAVILASVIAIYGINSWRREATGKRRIELAETTLILFYRAQDAIVEMRSPFGWSNEGKSREAIEGESEAEKRARDRVSVVFERYSRHSKTFADLRMARYQFKAYFGGDVVTPFDDMALVVHEIFDAAHELAEEYWLGQSAAGMDEAARSSFLGRKNELLDIYRHRSSNDPITSRVEALVAGIEQLCRPILNKK